MESHNRLLALLNSAASPPAAQANPSSAHQPPSTAPPTLNPPSGTVREPSPFPPPPSLQSVSLNDLFRNLGPPSPATQPQAPAQSGANAMNPSAMMQGSESHANNLLGMLGRVGGGQTGSGSQSGPMSPPNGAGTPLGSNQAINLLSMFKRYVISRQHRYITDHPAHPQQNPPMLSALSQVLLRLYRQMAEVSIPVLLHMSLEQRLLDPPKCLNRI